MHVFMVSNRFQTILRKAIFMSQRDITKIAMALLIW